MLETVCGNEAVSCMYALIGLKDTVGCEDVEGDARSGQLLTAWNMETFAKVLELVARDCWP